MLYIEQSPPPLRAGQEVTGIRAIIASDPNMENVLHSEVSMDPTLTIGIPEEDFQLAEDTDYYVFTQAITNLGYTVTTDPTLVRKEKDSDNVILTKLPINFEIKGRSYYRPDFHPAYLFYLVGDTDDGNTDGCTYSYIIEHFDFGTYRTVYAELDILGKKTLVDVMLKHMETYRVTIITRYSNRSTSTYRYIIHTAPMTDKSLPIESLNSSTDIIRKAPGIQNLKFMNREGEFKLELPKGYPAALVFIYRHGNNLVGYEYYRRKNLSKILRLDGTL